MIAIPVAAKRHWPDLSACSETELVSRARASDEHAVRVIIQRNNQRLFRAVRSVVGNDAEAEDIVQATYVQAFINLSAFRGDSRLSTWLTRIALNEALGRVRRRRDFTGLEDIDMQSKTLVAGYCTSPPRCHRSIRRQNWREIRPGIYWNLRSMRCRTNSVRSSFCARWRV